MASKRLRASLLLSLLLLTVVVVVLFSLERVNIYDMRGGQIDAKASCVISSRLPSRRGNQY